MFKQGYSLGKQLSALFSQDLTQLCQDALFAKVKVWFLGRDCDVFYTAYREVLPNVKYIAGLNRDNARKLQHRGNIVKWLKSLGVKSGDIIVDSGYNGSIFARIERENTIFFQNICCVLLTANSQGFTGEALSQNSICDNRSALRHTILALEHSPKREVCSWDENRRVPKVVKAEAKELAQATAFYEGCVKALKEGVM